MARVIRLSNRMIVIQDLKRVHFLMEINEGHNASSFSDVINTRVGILVLDYVCTADFSLTKLERRMHILNFLLKRQQSVNLRVSSFSCLSFSSSFFFFFLPPPLLFFFFFSFFFVLFRCVAQPMTFQKGEESGRREESSLMHNV